MITDVLLLELLGLEFGVWSLGRIAWSCEDILDWRRTG
jgi:hypothetical protein